MPNPTPQLSTPTAQPATKLPPTTSFTLTPNPTPLSSPTAQPTTKLPPTTSFLPMPNSTPQLSPPTAQPAMTKLPTTMKLPTTSFPPTPNPTPKSSSYSGKPSPKPHLWRDWNSVISKSTKSKAKASKARDRTIFE